MLILLNISNAFAEEADVSFDFAHMWAESGFIAKSVIVTLVLMLFATFIIAIERQIAFGKSVKQSKELAASIVPSLQKGDIGGALALAKGEDFSSSYLAGMLAAGLAEMDERADTHGIDNAKRALDKAANRELSKLKRGMPILATVGSTAPFVGLFGTTFGVINAFAGMASGGGGLADISTGISEALITTGVGIGVAIVGVWFFNFFNNRTDKINAELAESEVDFLNWAYKLVQAPPSASAAK